MSMPFIVPARYYAKFTSNETFHKIWYNQSQYVLCIFLPFIANTGNVSLPEFKGTGDHYLYTTKCNYVDLNADENGLWAIYATPKSTNTYVVKVKSVEPGKITKERKKKKEKKKTDFSSCIFHLL